MVQSSSIPGGWAHGLSLVASHEEPDDPAGLRRLPAEWAVIDRVAVGDHLIDHVVVGPNGVFAVSIDPDPEPARMTETGLHRGGVRVTRPIKDALSAAHRLRARLSDLVLVYPLLVAAIEGEAAHLDRLGVVPEGRVAEAIWRHPGRPMRRSARVEALWALRGLARH